MLETKYLQNKIKQQEDSVSFWTIIIHWQSTHHTEKEAFKIFDGVITITS